MMKWESVGQNHFFNTIEKIQMNFKILLSNNNNTILEESLLFLIVEELQKKGEWLLDLIRSHCFREHISDLDYARGKWRIIGSFIDRSKIYCHSTLIEIQSDVSTSRKSNHHSSMNTVQNELMIKNRSKMSQ